MAHYGANNFGGRFETKQACGPASAETKTKQEDEARTENDGSEEPRGRK
jgi:hypothetical protein